MSTANTAQPGYPDALKRPATSNEQRVVFDLSQTQKATRGVSSLRGSFLADKEVTQPFNPRPATSTQCTELSRSASREDELPHQRPPSRSGLSPLSIRPKTASTTRRYTQRPASSTKLSSADVASTISHATLKEDGPDSKSFEVSRDAGGQKIIAVGSLENTRSIPRPSTAAARSRPSSVSSQVNKADRHRSPSPNIRQRPSTAQSRNGQQTAFETATDLQPNDDSKTVFTSTTTKEETSSITCGHASPTKTQSASSKQFQESVSPSKVRAAILYSDERTTDMQAADETPSDDNHESLRNQRDRIDFLHNVLRSKIWQRTGNFQQQVQVAFNMLNRPKGPVTAKRLRQWLRRWGAHTTEEECVALFTMRFDKSGKGAITFDEFVTAAIDEKTPGSNAPVDDYWSNKRAIEIVKDEAKRKEQWLKISDPYASKMPAHIDQSKFRWPVSKLQKLLQDRITARTRRAQTQIIDAYKLFGRPQGGIQIQEFRRKVAMFGIDVNEQEAKELFALGDQNGDGTLSFVEFVTEFMPKDYDPHKKWYMFKRFEEEDQELEARRDIKREQIKEAFGANALRSKKKSQLYKDIARSQGMPQHQRSKSAPRSRPGESWGRPTVLHN